MPMHADRASWANARRACDATGEGVCARHFRGAGGSAKNILPTPRSRPPKIAAVFFPDLQKSKRRLGHRAAAKVGGSAGIPVDRAASFFFSGVQTLSFLLPFDVESGEGCAMVVPWLFCVTSTLARITCNLSTKNLDLERLKAARGLLLRRGRVLVCGGLR
jgi:hypothetical protein